ncbi:hypothetical protein PISMIDRAFT_682686, partial [Pisolithus microcarpus 441]
KVGTSITHKSKGKEVEEAGHHMCGVTQPEASDNRDETSREASAQLNPAPENHSDTFLALVQVLNLTQEAHLMPIAHSMA